MKDWREYCPSATQRSAQRKPIDNQWLGNGVGKVQGPPNAGAPEFHAKNNADIVLSPTQNLQVITIHNYLCCMGVLCTYGWNF